MCEANEAARATAQDYPEAAATLLREILTRMGYDVEVQAQPEAERLLLTIDGEAIEELTSGKGQVLDALQVVANRVLGRQFRDDLPLVVDCGGYRARRVEALKELAAQLGEKAMRLGKVVAVNPLCAHDRRVIHMALRETVGVTTQSEGDGEERRLLIMPTAD